jgi:zinc D-Ala-D-Ala carboxypeptidase
MIITSGFRSYDVELRVSGKDYGQHRRGQAADFVLPPNMDIVLAYESIWRSAIPYDQLLLEQSGTVRWIHVSYGPGPQRKQALWSPDNGQRWAYYFPGISQSNPQEATT